MILRINRKKKIFFISTIIVIIVLAITYNYLAENSNLSIPHFEEKIIDIGRVSKESNAFATFKLNNIGTSLLYLRDVIPDCSCTNVSKSSNIKIRPNESYEIRATYDKSKRGFFEQTIKVYFKNNAPDLLIFRGQIE